MSEETKTNAIAAAPGPRAAGQVLDPALESVRQALAGLQFGQVTIIVQDGVVVQLERTDRHRFRRGENRITRP